MPSVKITRKLLRDRLNACSAALDAFDKAKVLPVTIHTDPDKNLPLVMNWVDRKAWPYVTGSPLWAPYWLTSAAMENAEVPYQRVFADLLCMERTGYWSELPASQRPISEMAQVLAWAADFLTRPWTRPRRRVRGV